MRLVKRPLLLAACYLALSVFSLWFLYSSLSAPLPDNLTFNKARVLVNPVLAQLELGSLGDLDYSWLASQGARVEVVDLSGVVLYDSAGKQGRVVDLATYLHYDASLGRTGYVKFAFPVIKDGLQVANAVFYLPRQIVAEDQGQSLDAFLPIAALVVLVLVAAGVLGLRYRVMVNRPLEQLSLAASQVARGNFDGQLNYVEDDALGKVFRSFDIMRLELKDAQARQQEYQRERKELITKISHDLKTPVSSIKAYVEGLRDGMAKDPAKADKYLAVIDKKTNSLVALIDDLLQHSLSELGQLRVERNEQYSGPLLERIVEPLVLLFEGSGVRFSVAGELPNVLVNVDAVRLEQVVVNLVENAKKYTAPGGIVEFSVVNQPGYLKFSVKDTGMGIGEEELPRLFDPFFRGKLARDFEGAGLGLAICQYIVEEHGGKIWVESKLGSGSTFTFTMAKA